MVNPLAMFGIANWIWDIIALVITFALIMVLIRLNDILRNRDKIPTYVSRKVFHTFAGPLFIICWLLFSGDLLSRYIAAIVPLIFAMLYVAVGTGVLKNEEFVQLLTRSGKSRELLFGNFLYCLVMVWVSIACFFIPVDKFAGVPFIPTAILVFGPMAGGDGLADMVGQKWGKHKFKVFSEKSVEGTLAMLVFGFLFTYVMLAIFSIILNPVYPAVYSLMNLLIPVIAVSLVATVAEALSPRNIDNLVVPVCIFLVLGLFWYLKILGIITLYPSAIWNFTPV
ncbi:MAG: diacylglycerol/polyprenol kinase family protein [Promethearchaeota archaeon]